MLSFNYLGYQYKSLRTWALVSTWDGSFHGPALVNEMYSINGALYMVLHVFENQIQTDANGLSYLQESTASFVEKMVAVSDVLQFTPLWDNPIDAEGRKKFVPMGPAMME